MELVSQRDLFVERGPRGDDVALEVRHLEEAPIDLGLGVGFPEHLQHSLVTLPAPDGHHHGYQRERRFQPPSSLTYHDVPPLSDFRFVDDPTARARQSHGPQLLTLPMPPFAPPLLSSPGRSSRTAS